MTESQLKSIARYLSQGKKLTSLEALRMFGCLRLSGRIHDLRHKQKMHIMSKTIVTLTGKRISQYYMNATENKYNTNEK